MTPATRYFYYVRPVCEDGTSGTWSNVQSFETECLYEGVTLPLRENFDKIEATGGSGTPLPVCWSVKLPPSATGSGAYVNKSDYAASPYNFVYCSTVGSTYVITPKINSDLKKCQVRFAFGVSNKYMPLEVGIMTDPTDNSTFVKLGEYYTRKASVYNDYGWTYETCIFEEYTGDGQYVAFHFPMANLEYRLDDIVVEDASSCAEPKDLHSVSATTASITLDWMPSENNESEWEIAYAKSGSTFAATSKIKADTHPYELTGLQENVTYDIYIRAVCSEDAQSIWVGPYKAKTNSPAKLPFVCDFESASISGAWNLLNGIQDNQWIVGDILKDENKGTGNTLYISADYGATNTVAAKSTYSYATRLMELEAGLIDFEFDWRLPGADEYQGALDYYGRPKFGTNGVIIPFLVPENIVIEGGVSGSLFQLAGSIYKGSSSGLRWDIGIPEGWIRLSDGLGVLAHYTSEWQHYKYTYPLRKSGRYNFVLVFMTPSSESKIDMTIKSAAVDNVKITANTTDCITPVDLVVREITQSSAKVEFLNYNATEWKTIVAVEPLTADNNGLDELAVGDENGHVLQVYTSSTNPVVIKELEPETEYHVYIRPACGSAETWSYISFFSICDAFDVPVAYTFDEEEFTGENAKLFMDCWRHIPDVSTSVDQNGNFNLSSSSSGIYKFRYESIKETNNTQMLGISSNSSSSKDYNGPTYVASPELATDVKELMLSLRIVSQYDYASVATDLEIGVMTDPLDTATFTLIETVSPLYAGKWKRYYIYFDKYEGTGKHIAMRLPQIKNRTANLFIDDLKIDIIRGCVPVRGVDVENITDNSADIVWDAIGTDGNYHVKLTSEPLGRWEDRANVWEGTVKGESKVTVKDLKASKQYYVYVRTVCDNGGFSEGISEAQFRTQCGSKIVLPYYENFDSYELNSLPDCWNVVENNPAGGSKLTAFNITTNLGENYKQRGRLSLILQTGAQYLFPTTLALPEVSEDVKDLCLSFYALQGMDNLVVGVLSDVNDPKTFVAVDTIVCASKYVWEEKKVYFDKYTGNGKYIAFHVASSWFASSFHIDDVILRKASVTCADAVAPQVLNIESTSATVRWAEHPSADQFELKVSSSEINPEIEDGNVMVATKFDDLQTELTGLTPATVYYVYLRNVCGGGEGGYWSAPTEFTTACENPEQIPYFEDFTGFGDIADQGFFPVCWRRRLSTYGSISPDIQPEPYIENSTRPSLFMKAVYDGADNAYVVADAATPKIEFADGISGYVMRLEFKSNVAYAPIYVGLMSDPSDATTFVAYDTLYNTAANVWEQYEVNFFYHEGKEQHIAFRINSLDGLPDGYDHASSKYSNAYNGYQVNITDINVIPMPECMPPYRVHADIRPNRAFITWLPGNENGENWVYYFSKGTKMDKIPFTDDEWNDKMKNNNESKVVETQKHSIVLNNLKDWTSYYMYIRNKDCDEAFWPQIIDLSDSRRGTCGRLKTLEDLPVSPDFTNNGFGVGDEPEYSAYFDCWSRSDDFTGDDVAYPYITEEAELWFHTQADSVCYAYIRETGKADTTFFKESQLRFTAKALAEGAKAVIGFSGRYSEGWPAVYYNDFVPYYTIDLSTDYQEYVVKFEDFVWKPADAGKSYSTINLTISIEANDKDFVINDLSWEAIPYCFTPELKVLSHSKTDFRVEWNKMEGQDKWDVAYGEHGFDIETAKLTARVDTNYTVVNLEEGTPYEFYLHSFCDNGLTSEWGRICVTTDQTPAVYPYSSSDFADATLIEADDTLRYAYRTIDLIAGPHNLTFDWKTANEAGAYLRVFMSPVDQMISADADFGITETSVPEGWQHIATLKGKSVWTPASHTLYVKTANSGPANLVFVWTKSGSDVQEVIRNINVGASSDCTVPDDLSASQITSSSAVLSWISYNADNWDINYWETDEKAATMKTLMDVQNGHKLSGLKADTEYSFEVASACKQGQWSDVYTFRTACETTDALYETFDDGTIGGCWALFKGNFDQVTADPTKLVPTNEGWNVTSTPILGSSGTRNARLTVAGTDCNHWLVSPAVKLEKTSALSFDLSFTAYNGQQPVNANGQEDDRFIVAISSDEGQTWKAADATIWDNAGGLNYSLNRIGNQSSRIEVDLSAYTGKTIRVAFYGESTVEVETNDIHIDSVRIDQREVRHITAETCNGYSYHASGFSIDKADLQTPGLHKYTRVERSSVSSKPDTTVVLSLMVKESKERVYEIQHCSDTEYSDENFSGLTVSGEYIKVFTAGNGCDSTVILVLTVNPSYRYERELEIEATELPFTFECHEFPVGTETGVYEVNCTTEAGCDSVIVLKLKVTGDIAVNNATKNEVLILTPNPVDGGQQITVNRDFDFNELNGMTIAVYNSLGQCVSVSKPTGLPVSFNAPDVAGVYAVHITLADKKTLVGRFIVK